MITTPDKKVSTSALAYLKGVLAQGKSLSRALLDGAPLSEQNILVMSASPLGVADVSQFDVGSSSPATPQPLSQVRVGNDSYIGYPTENASHQMADLIYRMLERGGSVGLLENSLAEAGDPWLARASSRIILHERDVIHEIASGDSKATIEQAIGESHSNPISIGAISKSPFGSASRPRSAHEITKEQLAEFSRSAYCIFVGAYDGEGYVVWTREPY